MSVYVSSLLTATAATVNADPASTRTWQWQRNGVNISGATNQTYSAAVADIGANIAVVQTETNFLGTNNATSASVGPVVSFSPIAFFGDGSPGWWYDNDDITTLYQDSAGTTPVTAVEQSVGLQLDKSRGGVGTNGTRRINLLTYTERFDNAAWGKAAVTVTANATTAPDNTATADLWSNTSTTYPSVFQSSVPVSANTTYVFTVFAKVATHNVVSLELRFASGDDTLSDATYNLTTLAVTTFAAGATATCTDVGNGWRRLTLTRTNPGSGATAIGIIGGSAINSGDVLSTGLTFYIWGADIRLAADANVAPTYQPITATWYDTLPGNHRYQTTSGSRPVWSKRVNRLTKTEQFDDAAWTKRGTATITPNDAIAPNGTLTADKLSGLDGGTNDLFNADYLSVIYGPSGLSYTPSIYIKRISTSGTFFIGNPTNSTLGQWNVDMAQLPDSWVQITATTPGVTVVAAFVTSASGQGGILVRGISGGPLSMHIWGADARLTNQATGLLPLYQRVNTATDYDTNGFPGYLKADGTDDFLQTNSIDFSATDKVTLCAGVRKLSDAATATVVDQNGVTGTNAFMLRAPSGAAANYAFFSGGSAGFVGAAVSPSSYASPITNVLTGIGNISGDSAILRINGTQSGSGTADQGTGNYSNLPVYFFRRQGSALPFNGEEYANIAVGKLLTADQLTALETYTNSLTKAY